MKQYSHCLLNFLDRHSGALSTVGLIMAALGLLLTLRYLSIYQREIRERQVEQKRLEWERILKLLHQIAKYAAMANVASATHSPLLQAQGFLPPQIAEGYKPAVESLFAYWHQLRVELDIMPMSELIQELQEFILLYDASTDAKASEQFAHDLFPITAKVKARARKKPGSLTPSDLE